MKKLVIFPVLLLSFGVFSNSEKQLSKKEYVEKWRTTAVQQMIQFKIPASITLAQAILESGSGNSELAKKGNNHFGIKCHDWTGATMYIDDDKKGECFRVYTSAEESYVDHSEFLANKKRYQNLFNLEMTDYAGWARGLKEAGYATNPKYADLLIDLIKDLKLDELDKLGITSAPSSIASASGSTSVVTSEKHQVWTHENKVKYIVAKRGDTYYRISKEFGLALWQLYKYNDFGPKKDVLEEGDIVYIQPKRHKAKKKKSVLITNEMTVNELAQLEAIQSSSILKKNDIDSPERVLRKGEKIILR